MDINEYAPIPMLVTRQTRIEKPRFPVIDAHNHLGAGLSDRIHGEGPELSEFLDTMDQSGLAVFVDLDGGISENVLALHLDEYKQKAPDRFVVYAGVNWEAWPEHGDHFGEWAAGRLRLQAARGAQGLKIFKDFGLHVHDQNGKLVAVDDVRLDPIWAIAGELKLPITIHVADPVAFFEPLDHNNERWDELHRRPEWHFASPPGPSFLSLVNGLATVVARHPRTVFVAAHVGCYAENLEWVGQLLDRCPNFNVDISARIAELGRQPYAARRFFLHYADRIVFGLDGKANPELYRIYYRFLETGDEYFSYTRSAIPGNGRWQIYGLYLPDDVLEKVYYKNAARLILKTS